LPPDYLRIDIDVTGPDTRRFRLASVGTAYEGVIDYFRSHTLTPNP
jgi:hypothetical protein